MSLPPIVEARNDTDRVCHIRCRPVDGVSLCQWSDAFDDGYDGVAILKPHRVSPLLALLRHHEVTPSCLLPVVKRSYRKHRLRSESDPGCAKTHTSTKRRKYNSPTRYRAESTQNELAAGPRDAFSTRRRHMNRIEQLAVQSIMTRQQYSHVHVATV